MRVDRRRPWIIQVFRASLLAERRFIACHSVRLAVAATPAPRSLSDDSGPLSLATALFQEHIYFVLDYLVVGPLL